MKKLLAIAVIFALVTGAAFAETAIGGVVETRFSAQGSNASGDAGKPTLGGGVGDAYLQLSGENDDGTFGGLLRLNSISPHDRPQLDTPLQDEHGNNITHVVASLSHHRAFIWWRPIDQLQIFLGQDPDGKFSLGDGVTDWAFHRGGSGYINYHNWDYWRIVFPGNWDSFGLCISLYPIEGLELNFILPTGGGFLLEDIAGHFRFQGSFEIQDIGKIMFSYAGPGMSLDAVAAAGHSGVIGGAFRLTAIDGLTAQLGVSTYLAKDSNVSNKPLFIGLFADYNAGDWGVKFRGAMDMGGFVNGRPDQGGWRYGNNTNVFAKGNAFQFNIMPYYNMEIMSICFDFGLRIQMLESGADTVTYWHANPYFKMPIPGGEFRGGLKIDNNASTVATDVISWSIPLAFVFNF